MGYIKEPTGIDFEVINKGLSAPEHLLIKQLINKKKKIKPKNKSNKALA
jgi:hypothetical protein